MTIQMGEVSL